MDIQMRHRELGDVGVSQVLAFPVLGGKAAPVAQPLMRHPEAAAGVALQLDMARHKYRFIDVMRPYPSAAKGPTRDDLLDAVHLHQRGSQVRIVLQQLLLSAIASRLRAGLQGELGRICIALGSQAGLEGELEPL
jgi:hypothetical protein